MAIKWLTMAIISTPFLEIQYLPMSKGKEETINGMLPHLISSSLLAEKGSIGMH
jgi:hypothetical protein